MSTTTAPRTRKVSLACREPQARFNGGYHDGAQAEKRGWTPMWKSPHFDALYEAGYWMGRADYRNGDYAETSTAAWQRYRAD